MKAKAKKGLQMIEGNKKDIISFKIDSKSTNKDFDTAKDLFDVWGVKLTFDKVIYNDNDQIIAINIIANTEKSKSMYQVNQTVPIENINIYYNKTKESVSIESSKGLIMTTENSLNSSMKSTTSSLNINQNLIQMSNGSFTLSYNRNETLIHEKDSIDELQLSIEQHKDSLKQYRKQRKKLIKEYKKEIKNKSKKREKELKKSRKELNKKRDKRSKAIKKRRESRDSNRDDITGHLAYKGNNYYYIIENNKCDFYDRYGNMVSDVLAKELIKELK